MAESVLSAPHFHDEAAAFAFVEARLWPKGPVCPFCGCTDRIGTLKGTTTRVGLRKCYSCRKNFTVRHGTLFADSHLELHLWLQAIHLLCASKKGISSNQLHRILGCTLKTAWFLSHRIREAMKDVSGMFPPDRLGGAGKAIEADETYVGRKGGSKAYKPNVEKMPVVALVERDGRVRSFHVAHVTGATVGAILARHVHADSRFITDEHPIYKQVGWNFASHATIMHTRPEYVRGDVHTNTVEGYFSILKRGLTGIYQHVSEAHLGRYLAEFDFRYSNRVLLGINDETRAEIALRGVVGKRLTYETTRSGRATQTRGAPAR